MDSRLTDAELIQLVQEKLPEELTHAEIRQLHERLNESDDLKAVLFEQLQLESYLSTALAEINLSVDEIVRRASQMEQPKKGFRWPLWTGLAGVLLLIGLGIFFATRPQVAPNQIAEVPKENNPSETGNSNLPPIKEEDSKTGPGPDPKPNPENDPKPDPKPPNPIAQADPVNPRGKPTDPWFEALDPDIPLRPIAETAFEMPLWKQRTRFDQKEAGRWFVKARGQSFRLTERSSSNERWVQLEGAAKLKAPLVPDGVLRMSLFDTENFRLHFWCGDVGVTLWHYRQRTPNLWAAYQSHRKPNTALPEKLASLLTTDNGRHARVRSEVFEFRFQNGALVMSQGETRLLSVPLPKCPTEVIFDGKCCLSELTMYRGESFPKPEPNPRPLVLASTQPAKNTWFTKTLKRDLRERLHELGQAKESEEQWEETLADGASISINDGKVRLAVDKEGDPVQIAMRLKRPGFYEVIFRVEHASPGTAVYFGDDQGTIMHRMGFQKDRQTGQTVFRLLSANDTTVDVDHSPKTYPAGYFAPGQWFRAVWGFGSFKLWTSPDGEQWGIVGYPSRNLPGPFSSVGLLVQRSKDPLQITLSHLEIREFSAITSLASNAAFEKTKPFEDVSEMSFGSWNQLVMSRFPESNDGEFEISMEDWRRACAIRTLMDSPQCLVSSTLLRRLIEEGIAMEKPWSQRFRLLDEVSLLYDLWSNGAGTEAIIRVYERLGMMAASEGHPDPFGLTLAHLRTAPIFTDAKFPAITPELTRDMLMHHMYHRDWEQLRSVSRRTEFLMLAAHPQKIYWWEKDERELLVWAENLAQHQAPEEKVDRNTLRRVPRGMQKPHPLVTQVSKEGYNVMAEFEAALAGDAFEDACRIITSAGRAGMAGLLPDSKDPELLVSLPRAIEIAMRDYPELQTTMRDKFGDVGRVRVRESMSRADVEAVEAATVRFFGTEAASEAYRWLGDRALASGKFAQAAQAYQEALPFAPRSLERDLKNRLRLAAGMLGHKVDSEQDPQTSVQIASSVWTGPEFSQLIDELRKTHARAHTATLADWIPNPKGDQSPPPPAWMTTEKRNQISGDLGKGVGQYDHRTIDWAARQLAIVMEGDLMYVSNRFQVTCFQLPSGKTVWSRGLGDDQGTTSHWPNIAMQPVIVGDRIFVRRLTKRGPELACLSKPKGEVLWHVRPENHVCSDPVYVQNRLLALVVTTPRTGMVQLHLTAFHPETGDVLSQQPVLHLQDEWRGQPPCQITAASGRILCTIGGTTMCCDSLGHPQWLQQHPWLSPSLNRFAKRQHSEPPLISAGRVYVAQAETLEVSCMELATGRKHWTRAVPNLRRIVGFADGQVVIQTEMGLMGLAKATGKPNWHHAVTGMLNGIACGGDRIVYSKHQEFTPDGNVCLVWLDATTGEEQSHAILQKLEGEDVRFGPLLVHQEKLWAFFGRGYKDGARELLELLPDPKRPPAGSLHPNELTEWADRIYPRSVAKTAMALPNWAITSTQSFSGTDKGVTWLEDFQGQQHILKTRQERKDRPVFFVRKITLPKENPGPLKIHVGHEKGTTWTLRIQVNSRQVLEQIVDDKTAPNGWITRDVDLTPWAGKTVWISAGHNPTKEAEPAAAFWKSLQIGTE